MFLPESWNWETLCRATDCHWLSKNFSISIRVHFCWKCWFSTSNGF
jgi:hypothetical protein